MAKRAMPSISVAITELKTGPMPGRLFEQLFLGALALADGLCDEFLAVREHERSPRLMRPRDARARRLPPMVGSTSN